jgi:hypothetical protein
MVANLIASGEVEAAVDGQDLAGRAAAPAIGRWPYVLETLTIEP